MDAYSTHASVITKVLETVPLQQHTAILELGCGQFSTPLLRRYVDAHERCRLVSLESDNQWLSNMQQQLPPSDRHRYLNPLSVGSWSLAIDTVLQELPEDGRLWLSFIDSSPWDSRTVGLFKLRQESAYVVVHDCDYFPANGLWGRVDHSAPLTGPLLNVPRRRYDDAFNFWAEYLPKQFAAPTGPPTLVGSDYFAINLTMDDMVVASASSK